MAIQHMFTSAPPGTPAIYTEAGGIEVGNMFRLNADVTGWTCTGGRVWVDPALIGSVPANIDISIRPGTDIAQHTETKRRAVVAGWNEVTWTNPLTVNAIKLPFCISYKFVEDPSIYMSNLPIPQDQIVCAGNSLFIMDAVGASNGRSAYRAGTGNSVNAANGNIWGIDAIVNAPNVAPTLTLSTPTPARKVGDAAVVTATAVDESTSLTYAWSITAGPSSSSAQLSSTTASVVNFTPTNLGSYTLSCTVTDPENVSTTATIQINCIVPTQLVVNLPGQETPTRLVPYQLSVSTTGGYGPKTYNWSIVSGPGGGVTGTFSDIHAAAPTFTASDVGDFVLRCSITDTLYTSQDDMNVRALFEPPAPATFFIHDGFIWVPQTVEYL